MRKATQSDDGENKKKEEEESAVIVEGDLDVRTASNSSAGADGGFSMSSPNSG